MVIQEKAINYAELMHLTRVSNAVSSVARQEVSAKYFFKYVNPLLNPSLNYFHRFYINLFMYLRGEKKTNKKSSITIFILLIFESIILIYYSF